jgi:hypothetical protein
LAGSCSASTNKPAAVIRRLQRDEHCAEIDPAVTRHGEDAIKHGVEKALIGARPALLAQLYRLAFLLYQKGREWRVPGLDPVMEAGRSWLKTKCLRGMARGLFTILCSPRCALSLFEAVVTSDGHKA